MALDLSWVAGTLGTSVQYPSPTRSLYETSSFKTMSQRRPFLNWASEDEQRGGVGKVFGIRQRMWDKGLWRE